MEKIILDNIIVQANTVTYQFSTSKGVSKYFSSSSLFIEYEEDISNIPISILTIPFVNCFAGISWLLNCALFVDEIDETYYSSFKSLKCAYGELHNNAELKGIFVPSIIVKNNLLESDSSILLFGGGVDCHVSLLRNIGSVKYLINIYGWLNNPDEYNSVDEFDKLNTDKVASNINILALHVRSNFASLFINPAVTELCSKTIKTSYWYGFLHSMAFLSIASLLAWNHNISNIIIASSMAKGRADKMNCASYITTDREFRFAQNGIVVHDGFELNRQEKIEILARYQRAYGKPYPIQVCSFQTHNCCECEKCFRTVSALVAEGVDPQDFGFFCEGPLQVHWKSVVERNIALCNPNNEAYYYFLTANRMRENYKNIVDKDFVEWFLSCDFIALKKKAVCKYYLQCLFPIIWRKIRGFFGRIN